MKTKINKIILGALFMLASQFGMSQTGIDITPMSHDFGVVEVHQTSTPQQFTITNTGNETLYIDNIDIHSGFYIVGDLYPDPVIPPGDVYVFEVEFRPYANCVYNETMDIHYLFYQISVPLSGTGLVTAIDPPGVSIIENVVTPPSPFPHIDGNYVVWNKWITSMNYDIFAYDITTGITINVSNSPNHHDGLHEIEGDYIVWRGIQRSPWSDSEIFAYEISSGNVINISNDPSNRDGAPPHTDGEYVVWEKTIEDDVDIYVYNLSTNATYNVSSDGNNQDRSPRVSEHHIVWHKKIGSGYTEYEIFVHDLQDGTTMNISNEPNFLDSNPQISGKYVVWTRLESGNYEVYAHNLSDGTTFNVSNSPYYDRYAQVSGQYVVWQETQTYVYNTEILAYDLKNSVKINVSNDPDNPDGYSSYPSIFGDYVVWVKGQSGDGEIYAHHLKDGITINVSDNPQITDSYPEISGDYIVWLKWGSSCHGYDVALFSLASVPETAIALILDMVNDLVDEGNLNPDAGDGLIDKLNSILQKIIDGSNTIIITNQLCAFINQVNGLIPNQLSEDDGLPLIEAAQELIVYYGGDPDCNNTIKKSLQIPDTQTDQTVSLNCFPNPFSGKAIVSFNTPTETLVTLSVFDIYGRKKVTILNETILSGHYSFEVDASDWSPGAYYIKLQIGEINETRQMILLR